MSGSRVPSRAAAVVRLGFTDAGRTARLLEDPVLAGLAPTDDGDDHLVRALAATADPDQALLQLVRVLEAAASAGEDAALREQLAGPTSVRDRLFALLGASRALGDHLVRHPEHWRALDEPAPKHPRLLRDLLLAAVGADPAADVPVAAGSGAAQADALRVAYRRHLVGLAGRDLAEPDPRTVVAAVAEELADLAAAALEAALAVARAGLADHGLGCRLAVVGMGKCGGRELNYVSDVDVVFVAEPAEGVAEAAALDTGARLAAALMRVCSASTAEGTLWPVDANLRPEGQDGPLVRTTASHRAYYERWAKTWEFQALLKARPVAGDVEVGDAYLAAVDPMVWQAAERENFVEDVQAMRRRVEAHVPSDQAERQLKLGPGGLRDVEFSVQLLQLVHGRSERHLRVRGTLPALEELATYGYVGREDAAALDTAYRDLRVVEHRVQLARMHRTHLLPTDEAALRALGRAARLDPPGGGVTSSGSVGVDQMWRETRTRVRGLHERLFYRPLLAAAARLSTDEVRLTPEAARARLSALGYRDPAGAMRHLEALTTGVSRRAAIQRQLLPVLLGWFADGADPDGGLLAFRRVSDELGTTHWYLKMLRDSGAGAERLARVLASSAFVGERLVRSPESTRWLGDDSALRPVPAASLRAEVVAAAARQADPVASASTARQVRGREVLRLAVADVVAEISLADLGSALSSATSAALEGGLAAAVEAVRRTRPDGRVPVRLAVIGMGRLGGGELGFGSDADVVFVHEPEEGTDPDEAQKVALAVVTEMRRLLTAASPHPVVDVDASLRPEGRNGPLVRSLGSYAAYYQRWSLGWESQALLRAVPVAGDADVGERFVRLVDPLRYPEAGLPDAEAREIRRIKARVEAERLPRGVSPRRHLKLGPGGLSDVEWTVQLLQLQHAGSVPALRTTSTLGALHALVAADLVAADDAAELETAWTRSSSLRNAIVLARGRATDVLPTDRRDLDGVARLLGYEPGSATDIEEDQLRMMRRARVVMNRIFYG